MSTKGGYVENLNFREGNEESSEEARAEKARVYAEFDDCPRTEKLLKLLEFRHFERHILFSQSDRKEKKKPYAQPLRFPDLIP